MDWTLQQPAFVELLAAFRQDHAQVYLVGGAVRDLLLGRQLSRNDLDIVVEHDALSAARRVADRLGWAYYPMDEARDVARLVFAAGSSNALVCDVAAMRGGSIQQDLLCRDFTINAMALAFSRSSAPELIDVSGGQADLQRGVVRRVSALGLAEDAIRILRAVRLANQLAFVLDSATRTQMQRLAHTLRLVSPERVRDELWKMLGSDNPAEAVQQMQELGVLVEVLPEVAATAGVAQSYPHYQDVFEHTLAAVRHVVALRRWILDDFAAGSLAITALASALGSWRFRLRRHLEKNIAAGHSRAEWLVWHALFHDIGKPGTRTSELAPDDKSAGTPRAAPEERTESHEAEHETSSSSLLRASAGAARGAREILLGAVPAQAGRIRFIGHETAGAQLAVTRLTELRFSRSEIDLAAAVVAAHMRPHILHASFGEGPISRRATYRFFRDTGAGQADHSAGVDVLLVALADYQAIYPTSPPPAWSSYLTHASELLAYAYAGPGDDPLPRPLIDGHELMRLFHLRPGRQVGELLEYLREAQAAGEVSTTAEALRLASSWLGRQSD
jgi:tRNA nucleotidyltransferase/poly(A) polymerase